MEKQELVSAISKEIDFIQKSESRPGWTQWALLVAIAGLVWSFLKQIQQGDLDWSSVALWFFVGIIMWDTLIFLRVFFLKPKSSPAFNLDDSLKNRFTSPLESSLERGSCVSFLVRAGLVVFLMVMLPVSLNMTLKYIILVYYLGVSFVLILSVVYDFFDFPTSKKVPPKLVIRLFMEFFIGICVAFMMSVYLLLADMSYQLFWVNNIQVAFILLGILYLTSLYLSAIYSSDLLLLALRSTERDLIFGYIDTKSAQEQVDVIFKGRKMSHLLQEYVNDIILLLEKKNEYENKIDLLLTEAIENINETSTVEDVTKKIELYLDKIVDIRDVQIKKKLNRFQLRRYVISMVDPDAKYSFSSLTDKVQDLNEKSLEVMKNNGEKLKELKAKYAQLRLEHTQKNIEAPTPLI